MERGLTAATLLVVLTALGLTALLMQQTMNPETRPAVSIAEVLQRNLVMTRVALSVLLVIAWPLVLHGAAEALKLQFKRTDRFLTLIALLLAGLTYNLSFLPGGAAAVSVFAPAAISPFIFRSLLRMNWSQVFSLWFAQVITLGLLISVAFWGFESAAIQHPLNPLKELPVIYKLFGSKDNPPAKFYCAVDKDPFPVLMWESSGSDWIDLRANQAQVVAILVDRAEEWVIDLQNVTRGTRVDRARSNDSTWYSVRFNPGPEITHAISINTNTRAGDELILYSLLPVKKLE